jgi:hypothetical protein
MCPYYLDGDLAVPDPKVEGGSVIPVLPAALIDAAGCGFCAVFKDRGEASSRRPPVTWLRAHDALAATAGGRRSLKTQQHVLQSFMPLRETDTQ